MIEINDKYCIENDDCGTTIFRRYIAKSGKNKGKEMVKPDGYFSDPIQAIRALCLRDISGAEKLSEIVERFEQFERFIEEKVADIRKDYREILELYKENLKALNLKAFEAAEKAVVEKKKRVAASKA